MKHNVKKHLMLVGLFTLFLFAGGVKSLAQCDPEYKPGNECVNEAIQFTANAPGFDTYSWEFKEDPSGTVVGNSSDRDPLFVFTKAGDYEVTLDASGVAGNCSKTITITIKPSPIARPILLDSREQCFKGNSFCFIDSSSPAPASSIVRRTYLFGDGSKYDKINPKSGDTICHTVIDPKGGWFNLKIELEDANGCVTEHYVDKAIRVFPKLGVSISSNSPVKCDSTMATITNKTYLDWKQKPEEFIGLKDIAKFEFDFGNGKIIGDSVTNTSYWTGTGLDGIIERWYYENGSFDATLSVTSKFGCSETFKYKSAATNIKLNPVIIADNDSTCNSNPETCFKLKDGPIPGAGFLWNFGDPDTGPLNEDNRSWEPCHTYSGGGPWMTSIRIVSGPCDIMVFDTILKVGPASTIEVIGSRIPEEERYQCTIRDSVHFVNNSSWYHNDPNYWDEDSINVVYRQSFKVVTHPVTQKDSIHVFRNDIRTASNSDTLYEIRALTDVLNINDSKVWFDASLDSFVVVNSSNDTVRFGKGLGGVQGKRLFVFNFDPTTRTGDQTILENNPQVRRKDHVYRLWSLGDQYAPQCTTDTRANKNIGLNCNFSNDTIPTHWYPPWDEIYKYQDNGQFYRTPARRTLFSKNARQCYQVQVYPADTVRVPMEVVLFVPWDTAKTFEINYVDSFGVSKVDTVKIQAATTYPEAQIRDNYRLKIWRPQSVYKGRVISTVIWEDHDYYVPAGVTVKVKNLQNGTYRSIKGPKRTVINKDEQFEIEEGDSIISIAEMIVNPAQEVIATPSTVVVDTVINGKPTSVSRQVVIVDPEYHRSSFYRNVAQCNSVTLFHKDTVHPLLCESTNTVSLALVPPSARGLEWTSGIPCPLDGNKLQYYLQFDLSNTKPGCTQQWFEVNYDSLTGPDNWRSTKSGDVLYPPAPGNNQVYISSYQTIGQWGNLFVKGYTPGEVGSDPSKRPNGSFTLGLVVGNGPPRRNPNGDFIAPECTDTAWYTDMFRYQFLDANFDILVPQGTQRSMCAGETAYFRLVNPLQDSMAALRWNWGYPDRLSGYYEEFAYFRDYKGPVKGRNDQNVDWKSGDKWKYNYVIRHSLEELFGDETLDTVVTRIYREWTTEVNTDQADELITDILEQLGLDKHDVTPEQLALMLGDGSSGCIDTTGISQYFQIGWKGLDENVVEHGKYKYKYIDETRKDSMIVEEVLHFRDTSMQGYDTLIAPYDLVADGADTTFKAGSVIPGVYKFTYRHPEVRLNFCDPTKKDTFWVNSSGPMVPGLFLNNRVGCEKSGAKLLNVGNFNHVELVNDAVCKNDVHQLFDSIRYWQYGDDQWPLSYPLDPTKYWEDPVRYAQSDKETKAVDWDYDDGVDDFNRSISFVHQYDKPGEYKIALATKDSMGCRDTTFVTAFVTGAKANFETNLSTGGDLCDGIVSFFDSSIVFDPCRGRDTCPNGQYEACDSTIWYEWDFGDGSTRSVLKNPSHDYTSSGWFNVKLKITTLLGCSDSVEKRIFVAGPQPRFEFAGGSIWGEDSVVICVGDSVHLQNTSIDPIYDPNWVVYWGDSANSQSSSTNILTIFSHRYNKEGTYYLNMFMEDEVEAGKPPCTRVFPDTSTKDGKIPRKIKVIVRPVAPAGLEISDTVVCPDQLVTFTSNSDDIYTYYHFSFGNGDTAVQIEPTNFTSYSYNTPGTYNVKLIPNYDLDPGDFGPKCIDTAFGSVTVVDVAAGFDVLDKDKPEFCFVNTSQGAKNFEWLIESETRDTVREYTTGKDEQICYNWGETIGTFYVCLVATNDIGCADTVCKPIENDFRVLFTPYNVFTPNADGDDGLNDKFIIDIEGWEEFNIDIYNRWGELVFKTEDPANSWDGTIMNKGTECPGGTYFYVINYKLKNREVNDGLGAVSGTVTLIR
ncbi:MAG: PKD domain-containing protein [Bacteroidia bacterium]|nr:PKD domain-containing protein [Bacteroidia bacterium]